MTYLTKEQIEEQVAKADEAKAQIKKEFIETYYEWLKDAAELSDAEYWAKGYDVRPKTNDVKDNQKWLGWFRTNIFTGRWLPGWEKAGYGKYTIWELHHQGFLSYQSYSNWNARATGKTDWYYIKGDVAKEILKEYKEEQK